VRSARTNIDFDLISACENRIKWGTAQAIVMNIYTESHGCLLWKSVRALLMFWGNRAAADSPLFTQKNSSFQSRYGKCNEGDFAFHRSADQTDRAGKRSRDMRRTWMIYRRAGGSGSRLPVGEEGRHRSDGSADLCAEHSVRGCESGVAELFVEESEVLEVDVDVSERRRKEEAALAIVAAGRAEAETASTSLRLQ
jgi:hypothetical protein